MKHLIAAIAAVLLTAGVFVTGQHTGQPQAFGAISSPDIPSPYLSFGGVRRWAGHSESLNQATTTVCAIQAPAATSTLISGGIRLSVSSTTSSTITIAKASTATATTTIIATGSVGANAQATILAASSTYSAGALTDRIFAPNQYLVFNMSTTTGGTFSPSGVCQATWEAF
jgi:hypothetical protein